MTSGPPPLHCRHILSSRYTGRSSLRRPFLLFCPSLRLLQLDSASCVWTPVRGSTKWRAWTVTRCAATFGSVLTLLYAAQSSVCISVPGRMHLWIKGRRVPASLLSTTWKYPLDGVYCVETIPNTHESCLDLLPLLYWKGSEKESVVVCYHYLDTRSTSYKCFWLFSFKWTMGYFIYIHTFGLWLNLLSSHFTTAPGPPNGVNGLFCTSTEHTSCRRQIADTKLWFKFRACAIRFWGSSSLK